MLTLRSVRAVLRALIFSLAALCAASPARAEAPFGHATLGAGYDARAFDVTFNAFDSAFVGLPGGGGLELRYGRVAEARDPAASAAQQRGEMRFAGLEAHRPAFGPWTIGIEAEIGQAELARAGWHDVSARYDTSAFAARLVRPMDGARLAPLLGPGFATLTLALEQPLRLAQHEGAVFALADIGGELRAIDPSASGRETRLSARYDYVADASGVAAFAEASYAAEPYHIAGAEPDGRVRVGVSAKF